MKFNILSYIKLIFFFLNNLYFCFINFNENSIDNFPKYTFVITITKSNVIIF